MKHLFDLSGRVALCTGASSGIGQRMAWALSQAGADVVLVGRGEDKLAELHHQIEQAQVGKSAICVADLSQRDALQSVVEETIALAGEPDILVNAAGVNFRQPYSEISFENWDETLNLNLAVPFFLARECVSYMQKKGYGKIINIASLQSFRAFDNSIPYGVSKAGVTQMTRAMAQAWSANGINVNAIGPGFFPTALTKAVFDNPEVVSHHANMTAMGRNGKMEDIDGLTIFLASSASDYITGQVIMLDGGYTAK